MPNKGKDARGRFTKGNTYTVGVNKRKPGEVIEVHPEFPDRDIRGRALPGLNLSSGQGSITYPAHVQEIRKALQEAATVEDVKAVYAALFTLTQPGLHTKREQLDAIKLYLDRFFGKPVETQNVQQKTIETKVTVDLSSLTEEELQTYLQLQGKVQSQLQLEHKGDPEIVVGDNAEGE
jgi:hypothetical protein